MTADEIHQDVNDFFNKLIAMVLPVKSPQSSLLLCLYPSAETH